MSKLEGCSCPQGASFGSLPGSLCIFIIALGIGGWLIVAYHSFFLTVLTVGCGDGGGGLCLHPMPDFSQGCCAGIFSLVHEFFCGKL